MKRRGILSIVILYVLFSAPAFAQEQTEIASGLQSIIESGTVSTITVAYMSGVFAPSGFGPTAQIKEFKLSANLVLLLEKGNVQFYVDLTRAVAYAYDIKAKSLTIWIF
jgi:hypothetical protein